jgi:hypothetical protein
VDIESGLENLDNPSKICQSLDMQIETIINSIIDLEKTYLELNKWTLNPELKTWTRSSLEEGFTRAKAVAIQKVIDSNLWKGL